MQASGNLTNYWSPGSNFKLLPNPLTHVSRQIHRECTNLIASQISVIGARGSYARDRLRWLVGGGRKDKKQAAENGLLTSIFCSNYFSSALIVPDLCCSRPLQLLLP